MPIKNETPPCLPDAAVLFIYFFLKRPRRPALRAFLWDIYNTAEVLQVESSMNNGGTSVLLSCCADTDTAAALLMGARDLAGELPFFNPICTNQSGKVLAAPPPPHQHASFAVNSSFLPVSLHCKGRHFSLFGARCSGDSNRILTAIGGLHERRSKPGAFWEEPCNGGSGLLEVPSETWP